MEYIKYRSTMLKPELQEMAKNNQAKYATLWKKYKTLLGTNTRKSEKLKVLKASLVDERQDNQFLQSKYNLLVEENAFLKNRTFLQRLFDVQFA